MAELRITTGGHYTGDYSRVVVATTATVVLHDMNIEGTGTLLTQGVDGTRILLDRVRFRGDGSGRSVNIYRPRKFGAYFCTFDGCDGINLNGDGFQAERVSIRHNLGLDMQAVGRYANFVQLDKVRNVPLLDITDNEVRNHYGPTHCEDLISIFQSSGVPGRPGTIARNRIHGAYYRSGDTKNFSGSGVMFDGGDGTTGWFVAEDNEVYGQSNVGIGIAAGHNIIVRRNRVISDGTPGAHGALGFYHWKYYLNEPGFGDHEIYENESNCWRYGNPNNFWFHSPPKVARDNVVVTDPEPVLP